MFPIRLLSHHFMFALAKKLFTLVLSATLSIQSLFETAEIPDFTAFAISQNTIQITIATHNLGRKSVAIDIRSAVNQELMFTTSFNALSITSFAMNVEKNKHYLYIVISLRVKKND